MKKGIKNPIKIRVDFDNIKSKNFLEDFGHWLKKQTGTKGMIDVSKIWVNRTTYDKFEHKLLKELEKHLGNSRAKKEISWACLQYAPALDFGDTFGLEDDFLYLEEGFQV